MQLFRTLCVVAVLGAGNPGLDPTPAEQEAWIGDTLEQSRVCRQEFCGLSRTAELGQRLSQILPAHDIEARGCFGIEPLCCLAMAIGSALEIPAVERRASPLHQHASHPHPVPDLPAMWQGRGRHREHLGTQGLQQVEHEEIGQRLQALRQRVPQRPAIEPRGRAARSMQGVFQGEGDTLQLRPGHGQGVL